MLADYHHVIHHDIYRYDAAVCQLAVTYVTELIIPDGNIFALFSDVACSAWSPADAANIVTNHFHMPTYHTTSLV